MLSSAIKEITRNLQKNIHRKNTLIKVTVIKMEEVYDEDQLELENMRNQRKKMKDKDFAKLINKKDLSDFELDELFM